MNYLKTILLLVVIFPVLIGCSNKFTIPENALIDTNFVGKWEGKHYNEKSKSWKKWVQERKSDGTYSIRLKYFDKNDSLISETVNLGYWWIQNTQYNEISPKRMKKPEVYRYQLVDEDTIKFLLVNLDSPTDEKAAYSFVDKRISD